MHAKCDSRHVCLAGPTGQLRRCLASWILLELSGDKSMERTMKEEASSSDERKHRGKFLRFWNLAPSVAATFYGIQPIPDPACRVQIYCFYDWQKICTYQHQGYDLYVPTEKLRKWYISLIIGNNKFNLDKYFKLKGVAQVISVIVLHAQSLIKFESPYLLIL